MKSLVRFSMLVFLGVVLASGTAGALQKVSYGGNEYVDFTVDDQIDNETFGADGLGRGHHEDQENEEGTLAGEIYDMEAFLGGLAANNTFDGNILMVGQFDQVNGSADSANWQRGDIFLDVDGDALIPAPGGTPPGGTASRIGYDYGLRMIFDSQTGAALGLDVYALTDGGGNDETLNAAFGITQDANPWRVNADNQRVSNSAGVSYVGQIGFGYASGVGPVGTLNGVASPRNIVSFNLNDLNTYLSLGIDVEDVTLHYTMECGNDVLTGQTQPVPEPTSMALLGLGVIGLALRRRFVA